MTTGLYWELIGKFFLLQHVEIKRKVIFYSFDCRQAEFLVNQLLKLTTCFCFRIQFFTESGSALCGSFCLHFLYLMLNGKPYEDAFKLKACSYSKSLYLRKEDKNQPFLQTNFSNNQRIFSKTKFVDVDVEKDINLKSDFFSEKSYPYSYRQRMLHQKKRLIKPFSQMLMLKL